ncbi:MAG: nitroreductase family protein [Pseudomonadota bacterium]
MTEIAPLAPLPEVEAFLATRRSRPAKTLAPEPPEEALVLRLLAAAARCPDHGKLEPWRFVVIRRAAMQRVQRAAEARASALGLGAETAEKAGRAFGQGGVIVAVLASPKPSEKIPDWEQALSAGCVCYGLVNAALAAGWGANWLTGPLARDEGFLGEALGARPGEFAAGFVHIGRETVVPAERPRPDVAALTTWL